MRLGNPSRPVFFVPTFAPLRASICAVLGLSAAACGGSVTVETSNGGSGGDGGGGGTTVTTTGTTSTWTETFTELPCQNPVPVPQSDGQPSGYLKCADGTIHRAEKVACSGGTFAACQGNEASLGCLSDADCGTGNGKCAHLDSPDVGTYCGCVFSCTTDDDCGEGTICACDGVVQGNYTWPTCVPAACATDADCAYGECGISSYADGCGFDVELACRTPGDPCRTDSQCQQGYQCVTPYNSGTWSCQTTGCAIGRPLVVEGRPRTATVTARADWTDLAVAPETASLPPRVRAALAASWQDVAALEHASIASFARFSLELLALGAPPDLLVGAQRAAADEIEHARLAYGLAGAYADRALGPAPLDMRGVAPASDVRAIVTALVAEACVGETLGAAEARALAGFVSDPVLAATYERIADDEGRHAELGWATLAWLLRVGEGDLDDVAARAFDAAIAANSVDPALPTDVVAPQHGLLSSSMLGALRRQALAEVVAPCGRALLEARATQREIAPEPARAPAIAATC